MIKVINIFREIEDLETFKKQFFAELLPTILRFPGILGVKITTVLPMSSDMSQDIEGVQFVIDQCCKSQEVIDQLVHSPEGQAIMEAMSQLPGELSVYVGQERTYHPADYKKPSSTR